MKPSPKTREAALPRISEATVNTWRAAGIQVKLIRVAGGYLVQVR